MNYDLDFGGKKYGRAGHYTCYVQKTLPMRATLTGAKAYDPDVEEIEIWDAGLGIVYLIQPAPGASHLAKHPKISIK